MDASPKEDKGQSPLFAAIKKIFKKGEKDKPEQETNRSPPSKSDPGFGGDAPDPARRKKQ